MRWKRIKSKEVQAELKASKKIGPQYKSRLIACTQCGEEQETKTMQLRTTQGFRGIHCRRCGLHERCLHNECSCKEVWHRCAVHGIDPFVHQSRRGVQSLRNKKEDKGKAAKEEIKKLGLSSRRRAPSSSRRGNDLGLQKRKQDKRTNGGRPELEATSKNMHLSLRPPTLHKLRCVTAYARNARRGWSRVRKG